MTWLLLHPTGGREPMLVNMDRVACVSADEAYGRPATKLELVADETIDSDPYLYVTETVRAIARRLGEPKGLGASG